MVSLFFVQNLENEKKNDTLTLHPIRKRADSFMFMPYFFNLYYSLLWVTFIAPITVVSLLLDCCTSKHTFLPSPSSSLIYFSFFQEGTLVVGGPGSFYWQGNTLLLIIFSFPSFHPFTESLWVRFADTSLSYPKLTVSQEPKNLSSVQQTDQADPSSTFRAK